MTEQETFQHLKGLLTEYFDVPAEAITLEARLYEDLGIDSIDAVDMIVQLKKITGERIPPEQFKSVRTLQDVVRTIDTMMA